MTRILARFKQSRFLGLILKLALTLVAFWFALKDVDFTHLAEILGTQEIDGVIWASAFVGIQIILGGLRWRLVLNLLSKAQESVMAVVAALKLYYISIFFNCCLPGTVGGDVVRVWLTKAENVSLSISIHSVIIDRLIALVALGVLVLLTLSSLGHAAGFDARYWLPALLLLCGVGLWVLLRLQRILTPYQHVKPVHWLLQFLEGLRLMAKHPATSFLSLLYAVLSHLAYCMCGYALAMSLGIEITLMQCITFIPLVMLISTIPISIGGWGVREASMVGMLGMIDVPQAAALMLSIEMGFITIALSLPAAILWLAYRRKNSHMEMNA